MGPNLQERVPAVTESKDEGDVEKELEEDLWELVDAFAENAARTGNPPVDKTVIRRQTVQAPKRELRIPSNLEDMCRQIPRMTAEHIPGSVVSRFTVAWAEALEGMVAHHA